jgi:hypothetical protein
LTTKRLTSHVKDSAKLNMMLFKFEGTHAFSLFLITLISLKSQEGAISKANGPLQQSYVFLNTTLRVLELNRKSNYDVFAIFVT